MKASGRSRSSSSHRGTKRARSSSGAPSATSSPTADLRLGDVRRRRLDPRHHRRDHRPDRPRDLAAADGPPDLRRPHPRGADRHPRRLRRGRRTQRARAAGRPDRWPARRLDAHRRWPDYAQELVELTRDDGAGRRGRVPRRSPEREHDAEVLPGKHVRARTSRSPTWSSGPSTTSGWSSGCARSASTSRSCRASCRS